MALRRFFAPKGALKARNVTLGEEFGHRLGRVLRLKRGDHVILSDAGRDFEVQITAISPHAVTAVIVGEREAPAEPGVTLILYQALIRANRFDLVLEKGAEIGVSRFVPVLTARSQVQIDEDPSLFRAERWRRIVVEAAEQCGRGRPPVLEGPVTFEEAIRNATGLRIVPWEGGGGSAGLGAYLRGLAERPVVVSVFIGPEGGYSDEEIELARSAGATVVSLGQRIMRSETAGIVASAIVLEALGEMGV